MSQVVVCLPSQALLCSANLRLRQFSALRQQPRRPHRRPCSAASLRPSSPFSASRPNWAQACPLSSARNSSSSNNSRQLVFSGPRRSSSQLSASSVNSYNSRSSSNRLERCNSLLQVQSRSGLRHRRPDSSVSTKPHSSSSNNNNNNSSLRHSSASLKLRPRRHHFRHRLRSVPLNRVRISATLRRLKRAVSSPLGPTSGSLRSG